MIDNLPGKKFAEEHGYSLVYYDASCKSASYSKLIDARLENSGMYLFLKCWETGTDHKGNPQVVASLSRIFGMIEAKITKFSLLNHNFDRFEQDLISLVWVRQ